MISVCPFDMVPPNCAAEVVKMLDGFVPLPVLAAGKKARKASCDAASPW